MTAAQKALLINARDNGHALAYAPGRTLPFSASRDAAINRLVSDGLLKFANSWMAVITPEGEAVITA